MTRLVVAVALASAAAACGSDPGPGEGWPFVGSDQAHTKYSAAEEIAVANVDELEIAWCLGSERDASRGVWHAARSTCRRG